MAGSICFNFWLYIFNPQVDILQKTMYFCGVLRNPICLPGIHLLYIKEKWIHIYAIISILKYKYRPVVLCQEY